MAKNGKSSNQARKNAARRLQAATGQSYQSALREVSAREVRPNWDRKHTESGVPTLGCAYMMSAGMDFLIDRDRQLGLARHAEATIGTDEALTCYLCDREIDVATSESVNVGMILERTVDTPRGPAQVPLMPVWTHEGCEKTPRVWTWGSLNEERARRGLPVSGPGVPRPRRERRPGQAAIPDYFLSSTTMVTGEPLPLALIQYGEAHAWGADGYRAEHYSVGLGPIDLTGRTVPGVDTAWQVEIRDDVVTRLARGDIGPWYQPSVPFSAARWPRPIPDRALVAFLPAGTVNFAAGGDFRDGLADGMRKGLLLGALMTVDAEA